MYRAHEHVHHTRRRARNHMCTWAWTKQNQWCAQEVNVGQAFLQRQYQQTGQCHLPCLRQNNILGSEQRTSCDLIWHHEEYSLALFFPRITALFQTPLTFLALILSLVAVKSAVRTSYRKVTPRKLGAWPYFIWRTEKRKKRTALGSCALRW